MSDMQSYDDQIAEIRRKATTTAAGWAPKPDSVRSGDWIGEAGAALTHARNALLKAPEWQKNYTAQAELAIAIRCLETAIASEPRPSPTDKLSDCGRKP